jgi:hypothetical protein
LGPYVTLAALVNVDGDGYNTAAEFRPNELLAFADGILGVDCASGDEFVAFGREHECVANSESRPTDLCVARVELDTVSSERTTLLATVAAINGRHEFEGDEV